MDSLKLDRLIDTYELTEENFNKIRPYLFFRNTKNLSYHRTSICLLTKTQKGNVDNGGEILFKDVANNPKIESGIKDILITSFYIIPPNEADIASFCTNYDSWNKAPYTKLLHLWSMYKNNSLSISKDSSNSFKFKREDLLEKFRKMDKLSVNYLIEDYLKWANK